MPLRLDRTGVEDALAGCGDCAVELGLAHGASLLRALAGELTALRAGQGSPGGATLCCANLVSYYDMLSAMAVIENISARAEK